MNKMPCIIKVTEMNRMLRMKTVGNFNSLATNIKHSIVLTFNKQNHEQQAK
jgi:hypothetical protein